VIAIIQARMGSERLPGKVMCDIGGVPMIDHVVARTEQIDGVSKTVVAIPDGPADDRLAAHLEQRGVAVFRGPANDVLARYVLAGQHYLADTVIRITADCPLLSPRVSSEVLKAFTHSPGAHYASNTLVRSFPRGFDTEVIPMSVLSQASEEATDPAEREHVTAHVWRRPARYVLVGVQDAVDRSSWRLTVDTPQDLEFVRAVFDRLADGDRGDYDQIVEVLESQPDLLTLNSAITQKHPFG
jgi:spore coat polysaccharide biosynthesis protein SpsF